MSKIFDFNSSGLGSYRDSVSGTLGTNTNGVFKRTEKGYAWLGNGSNTKIELNQTISLGTVFSISCVIRIIDNTISFSAIMGYNDLSYPIGFNPSTNVIYCHNGVNFAAESRPELFDGQWHLLTITRNDTSVYFYIDNIVGVEKILASNEANNVSQLFQRDNSFTFKGFCNKIEAYDIILSTQERNNLYKDFLRNKGTGSSIHKNGFPIKPTDLSNKSGLIAAYNFIPS